MVFSINNFHFITAKNRVDENGIFVDCAATTLLPHSRHLLTLVLGYKAVPYLELSESSDYKSSSMLV